MNVKTEVKLEALIKMGLKPWIEGMDAVAIIPYSAINIKILKAKRGMATIQVCFEYNGKIITQHIDNTVSKGGSMRIMMDDNLKLEGRIMVS
jgi:hypothetical protein